jgi:cytochrome P450
MRLYPPAYLIGRTALGDDELGGYVVPAGSNVMINIYGLHRHPAYWRDPDAFQPERMLDASSSDPARFVFLPFGAGPRSCIGARFTMCEMQVILSSFARAFTLTPLDARHLRPSPQITLKTGRPVRLRLGRQAASHEQEPSPRPQPIPI